MKDTQYPRKGRKASRGSPRSYCTVAMTSAVETEASHIPAQLVDQLVRGYDALSIEIKCLDEQRRDLENKLSWAKQQVNIYNFPVLLHLMMNNLSSRSVATLACGFDRKLFYRFL
jgi:hypothetical protein